MNLQYITDNNGLTTAVIIPISEWNNLCVQKGIVEDIPEWHLKLIDQSIEDYKNHPEQYLDFNDVINNIEKKL